MKTARRYLEVAISQGLVSEKQLIIVPSTVLKKGVTKFSGPQTYRRNGAAARLSLPSVPSRSRALALLCAHAHDCGWRAGAAEGPATNTRADGHDRCGPRTPPSPAAPHRPCI
ncbi:unnamed protein product, partial [Nesidiocoris tenuis]